nr:hypothetical protein [uncultured Rhodopila sp.]
MDRPSRHWRAAFVLLPLLGLGSCNRGPVTVCITPQVTCPIDQAYAQTGTNCQCGDSKGVAATR